MKIQGYKIDRKVAEFIEANPLRLPVSYELINSYDGFAGTAQKLDSSHVIRLSEKNGMDVFSAALAHEYFHCLQNESGIPEVVKTHDPIEEGIARDFRSLVVSIRSLPLDLNANNTLRRKGIDLSKMIHVKYLDTLNRYTNYTLNANNVSRFYVFDEAVHFAILYFDSTEQQKSNLYKQVLRRGNPFLAQCIDRVIDAVKQCHYDTHEEVLMLYAHLIQMFNLWAGVHIRFQEKDYSSYEEIANRQL